MTPRALAQRLDDLADSMPVNSHARRDLRLAAGGYRRLDGWNPPADQWRSLPEPLGAFAWWLVDVLGPVK